MPPAANAEQHVAGVDILVAGANLDPKWRNSMIEMKVVDSLTLPDMALVRLKDPTGDAIDSHPLQLGKDLEIKVSGKGEKATTSIFKGQIAAVEPEFGQQGVVISIRAYDKAHKLNRQRKTRTFQQVSASDMIKKIAGESGLTAKASSTAVVHEFFQQSNETDWDFAWRLALMHDFEVVVKDTTLEFRPANKGGAEPTVDLKYQDTMISFRPRMTGVQQPKTVNIRAWDPKNKQVVTGTSANGQTTSTPGVTRAKVSNDLGGGTTAIADRVAANNGEANELAKATLNRMSDAFFEADGVAFGNPKIKAGGKVKVSGVGQQFSGTYTVTSSTHSYRGATGYQTAFQISGRSSRTLLELMRPPQERDWSASLVVGVVTNNNDPEQIGARAREVPEPERLRGVRLGPDRDAERRQGARPADAPAARRGGHHRLRARRHAPPDRRRLGLQRQGQARGRPPAEPRRIVRPALEREDPPALQEGLRDQVRPEHGRRDQAGREAHGQGQLHARDDRATASSRPSSTRSRPVRA